MRNTVEAMKNNISQLVDSIINMPRRERIRACKEMNATVDYFEERQMAGVVSTKNLLTLIRESYTSSAVAGFLANVLYYVDSQGLTDEVFQKLLHFPYKKMRRTFLVAISHCSISLYQLEVICKLQICTEAYAQLLQHTALNRCFTLIDVQKLVAENQRFLNCIDYASLAQEEEVSEDKRVFFRKLAQCQF